MKKWVLPFRLLTTMVIAAAYWCISTRLDWDVETQKAVNRMMDDVENMNVAKNGTYLQTNNDSDSCIQSPFWQEETFGSLPSDVKKYFHRAFLWTGEEEQTWMDYIKNIKNVIVEENGEMLVNGKWIPFSRTNYFSTSPTQKAGLVSDLKLKYSTYIDLPIEVDLRVLDTYTLNNGEEEEKAKLFGIFPSRNIKTDIQGRSKLRWLYYTPMFPSTLLPRDKLVEWKEDRKKHWPFQRIDTNDIILCYRDFHGIDESHLRVHFDSQGLITSMFSHEENIEFRFSEYDTYGGGVLSPSYIESGRVLNGVFRPDMKSYVTKVKYSFH